MSETIKRVAIAISIAMTDADGYLKKTYSQGDLFDIARAAIEELREPTVDMIYAVGSDYGPALEDNWQTMIDAALGKVDA